MSLLAGCDIEMTKHNSLAPDMTRTWLLAKDESAKSQAAIRRTHHGRLHGTPEPFKIISSNSRIAVAAECMVFKF